KLVLILFGISLPLPDLGHVQGNRLFTRRSGLARDSLGEGQDATRHLKAAISAAPSVHFDLMRRPAFEQVDQLSSAEALTPPQLTGFALRDQRGVSDSKCRISCRSGEGGGSNEICGPVLQFFPRLGASH